MNLDLVKCYKAVFSSQGFKGNYCNYIILVILVISIICSIYFCVKGYKSFLNRVFNLIKLSTNPTLNSQIDYKKTDNDESNNNLSSNAISVDIKNKSRNLILKIEKKKSSKLINNYTFGDNDSTNKEKEINDSNNIENNNKKI